VTKKESALLTLGKSVNQYKSLPVVRSHSGIGASLPDISLGLAHRNALRIAHNVLDELSEDERKALLRNLFDIFWEWKDKVGENLEYQTPSLLGALLGNNESKKITIKEYEERRDEKAIADGKELPALIDPWNCDPFLGSPIRLFNKLFAEKYEPLIEYIKQDQLAKYDYILALLIIMSNNTETKNQSGDCIMTAMELSESRMNTQKDRIEKLKPLAKETFNKKKGSRLAI